MTDSAAKDRNRARFPEATGFIDTMRETFGDRIQVVHVAEADEALGEDVVMDEYVAPCTAQAPGTGDTRRKTSPPPAKPRKKPKARRVR